MKALGRRGQEILNFIETSIQQNGFPPTVREIGQAVGLASTSTVHSHMNRLERKGYIKRDASKPRAIEMLKPNERELVVSNLSENERELLFKELVKRGYNVR